MSIKIMAATWPLDLPPITKLVLVALADFAADDGTCWPSIATIQMKTSLSARAVQVSIKRLKSVGLLTVKVRSGHSNVFIITPASNAPPQDMRGAPDAPTPAPDAPPPPHVVHPTPARRAPRIVIEPSVEPSIESLRPRAARSTACRIPTNFSLTESMKAYALGQGIDPNRTFENFVDYWTAASGTKARKCDWPAAWRMWCRNQVERDVRGAISGANRATHYRRPKTAEELIAEGRS